MTKYLAPRDRNPKWVLMFDDVDLGYDTFDSEVEGREAFEFASQSWNCTLLAPVPKLPATSAFAQLLTYADLLDVSRIGTAGMGVSEAATKVARGLREMGKSLSVEAIMGKLQCVHGVPPDQLCHQRSPEVWNKAQLPVEGKEKKFKHFCKEWDFMQIDETSPEFEACLCYAEPRPTLSTPIDDIGRECLITRDTHRLLTETSEDFADRMRRQLIEERRYRPQPDSSSISTEPIYRSDEVLLRDILSYNRSRPDNHPLFDIAIREACIKLQGFDPGLPAAKGSTEPEGR